MPVKKRSRRTKSEDVPPADVVSNAAAQAQPVEYVVERILEKRIRGGKAFYLVKWKDYPNSENTWEPEENLNCPALVSAFEKLQKARSSTPVTEKRRGRKQTTVTSEDNPADTPSSAAADASSQRPRRRSRRSQENAEPGQGKLNESGLETGQQANPADELLEKKKQKRRGRGRKRKPDETEKDFAPQPEQKPSPVQLVINPLAVSLRVDRSASGTESDGGSDDDEEIIDLDKIDEEDDEDKENKPRRANKPVAKIQAPTRGAPLRCPKSTDGVRPAKAERPAAYDVTREILNGFDRRLTPKEIVGVARYDRKLVYLMRWQETNDDDTDLVLASEANMRCPQIVISYLEKRVSFRSPVVASKSENDAEGCSTGESNVENTLDGRTSSLDSHEAMPVP